MGKNEKNSKAKLMSLKKLEYLVDEYISKGARGQFLLLFITIGCAILLIGLFAAAVTGETAGSGIWQSFIHLLDPGVVSGDDNSRSGFVFLMVIITLIGMIFTGMLISIINNALETKMTDLRKGRSQIVEEDHTIIIGFNENIFCIIEELIESNKNQQSGCGIIVLSDTDKEMMEQQIHENIPNNFNSKIICREGKGLRDDLFSKVSMENARSVIVNERDDFQTIRHLLAVTNYLRTYTTNTNIAAIVHNEQFKDAAEAIIEDFPNARILYFGDLLSKITAQVCRQPGLSLVLMDFFNYEGVEIYIESGGTVDSANGKRIPFPLNGKRFTDILNSTLNATIIGYRRHSAGTSHDCNEKRIILDPVEDQDIYLQDGDDLIVISEDDGEVILKQTDPGEDLSSLSVPPSKPSLQHACLLVLDWNGSLDSTLHYMRDFLSADSEIVIVSDQVYDITSIITDMAPIHVEFHLEPENFFSVEYIQQLFESKDFTNVLLVCRDDLDQDKADARTVTLLLQLRRVLSALPDGGENIVVTSQLHSADDQALMQSERVNDFIVGSELTNRILVQVANNPDLDIIFRELLVSDAADIYLRPAEQYIRIGTGHKISFAALTNIVYQSGDIVIGWSYRDSDGNVQYNMNLKKTDSKTFNQGDQLVIISQGD